MSGAICNMAFHPMETATSAKSTFVHTCKYVCKNPTEIMSHLSIVYLAAKNVDNNPSTAEDIRTKRHFLQRILNKLCWLQEYSADQVVAALIGQPADFQMNKCSQV